VHQEGSHVADVGDRLDVSSPANHEKAPGRDLVQKVIDITAVALTEDDRRPDDDERSCRIFIGPRAVDRLGLEFCSAVFIEWKERAVFIDWRGVESVNGDAAREYDPLDPLVSRHPANLRRAVDVCLPIERKWANIVAVNGGQIDDDAAIADEFRKCLTMTDVAFGPLIGKGFAPCQIADAERDASLSEQPGEPRSNETGTAQNADLLPLRSCGATRLIMSHIDISLPAKRPRLSNHVD